MVNKKLQEVLFGNMTKTNQNYTVYHCHSDLSNGVTNIDSITKFEEYVDYAASLGMKAFAFAEHGSVFQWVKKKVYIEKKGMKYIHAEEFYVTEELFQEPKTEEYQKQLAFFIAYGILNHMNSAEEF